MPSIAELMDEHYALLDETEALRHALATGDHSTAAEHLHHFAEHLTLHVRKEEHGVFAAMRDRGEFVDEVDALESEHRDLDAVIAGLDPASPDFAAVLQQLSRDLTEHVERENLGIFPVSVVSLGRDGWDLVEQAQQERPTWVE